MVALTQTCETVDRNPRRHKPWLLLICEHALAKQAKSRLRAKSRLWTGDQLVAPGCMNFIHRLHESSSRAHKVSPEHGNHSRLKHTHARCRPRITQIRTNDTTGECQQHTQTASAKMRWKKHRRCVGLRSPMWTRGGPKGGAGPHWDSRFQCGLVPPHGGGTGPHRVGSCSS